MNKIQAGLIFGVIAGIIDILPMIAMKLPLSADLSAFSLWVIAGFFIATSTLKINGALKGIFISFLVLLPNAFLIGQNSITDLIPVLVTTLILGCILGYLIGKYGK